VSFIHEPLGSIPSNPLPLKKENPIVINISFLLSFPALMGIISLLSAC
jgi:hypothetical protein